RDGVVAARVADRRQRVVLAHDRDRRPFAGLDRRAKRGLDAHDAALDLEALRCEKLREPGGRLDLLVTELGIVVDPARQRLEVITEAVDCSGDRVFEGGHLDSPGMRKSGLVRQAVNYTIAGSTHAGCARSSTRKRVD